MSTSNRLPAGDPGTGSLSKKGDTSHIKTTVFANLLHGLPTQWRLPRLRLNKPQAKAAWLEVGRSIHDVYPLRFETSGKSYELIIKWQFFKDQEALP
jgi:hypothetical protein